MLTSRPCRPVLRCRRRIAKSIHGEALEICRVLTRAGHDLWMAND